MSIRVVLKSPLGETVVRDVIDGCWAEPEGSAEVTLGEGLWALPGLVDAHSHIATVELNYQPGDLEGAKERARLALRAGVTLLLDKGWSDATALEVIRSVPPAERPEIEAAARIIAMRGGYFPGFALETDPGDLVDAVEGQASQGAGWVKLIGDWPRKGRGPVANFTEDELRMAVETATNAGSRVAIHTMAREVPSQAVSAGVHSIEHGLFLTEDDIAVLGSRGGMWVPTVLRVRETIDQLGAESSGGRLLGEGLANTIKLLPAALEAGVHVLTGTDLVGSPANVVAEAMALAACGLDNRQVVGAIGRSGHAATGRSWSFAVGTPADAVLFGVDPIEELGVLAHPASVIRHGVLV